MCFFRRIGAMADGTRSKKAEGVHGKTLGQDDVDHFDHYEERATVVGRGEDARWEGKERRGEIDGLAVVVAVRFGSAAWPGTSVGNLRIPLCLCHSLSKRPVCQWNCIDDLHTSTVPLFSLYVLVNATQSLEFMEAHCCHSPSRIYFYRYIPG